MNPFANVPDNIMTTLQATDAKYGWPAGTMASILVQEVGGNINKYLADPTTYHYAQGKDGVRRTSKGSVSTAFGPFGILDSTAKDPGYGVKPLKDKANLEEQIRFAGDYLNARIKQAGSFEGGIASYGQGPEYAKKVLSRFNYPIADNPYFTQRQQPEANQVASVPGLGVMEGVPQAAYTPEVPQQQPTQQVAYTPPVPTINQPEQKKQPLPEVALNPADFGDSMQVLNTMMQKNQQTVANGWNNMRGWL